MRNILLILWCMLFPLCDLAAQVDETPWQKTRELNLSRSHSVDVLLGSDLVYWEEQGRQIGRAFILNQQNIRMKIPGGGSIQQKVQLGNIKCENGKIITLAFNGLRMPIDEAYEAAKKAHISLSIPTEKLEKWYAESKKKRMEADSFSNGTKGNFYPSSTIQIHRTANPLYPWFVRIDMGWNITRRSKGRDEKWGWDNNPTPPEGYVHISLDAPSGKIYDLKEAWKHLEEPEGKKKSIGKRKPRSEEEQTSKSRKPVPKNTSSTQEEHASSNWKLFIAAFVVLFSLIAIWKIKLQG